MGEANGTVTVEEVTDALMEVTDPEIGLDIINMGLVYDIDIDEDNHVTLTMTLTSPGCPAGREIKADAYRVVSELPGVSETTINLVWTPPWGPDKMSEDAKLALGIFD